MLAQLGFQVVATDYGVPRPISNGFARVSISTCFLPFRSASFDGVDLAEVIEHIENQPQLGREINRVLKPGGMLLVSTPERSQRDVPSTVSVYRFPARPCATGVLYE
jgi:2-polyprenyl-3-methyl-5-hydroxy-6-metoxy-1,4-benzoquinol methylase